MKRLRALVQYIVSLSIFLLVLLLLLELLLVWMGYPVGYTEAYFEDRENASFADFRICDLEVGCRYNPAIYHTDCTQHQYGCTNSLGYFTREFDPDPRYRVMALGDSFTMGFSADAENRMWTLVDNALPDVAVYNLGINGSGTGQAVALLETYAPVIQPDLVVLGFYAGNDFLDNRYPIDNLQAFRNPPNHRRILFQASIYDGDQRLETPQQVYTHALTLPVCYNLIPICERFMQTRLGTITMIARDAIRVPPNDRVLDDAITRTREYLITMRDFTAANEIDFAVLVIPQYAQDNAPYQAIIRLLDELNIEAIDSLPVVVYEDYSTDSNDDHWLNSGHQKAARLLETAITAIRAEGR